MSVPIEFISLVIRRSSLDKSYPGGSTQFIKDYGPFDNRVNAFDSDLVKFGAMNPRDIDDLITELTTYGLEGRPKTTQSDEWIDFCIIDELLGITGTCHWMVYERSTREAQYKKY